MMARNMTCRKITPHPSGPSFLFILSVNPYFMPLHSCTSVCTSIPDCPEQIAMSPWLHYLRIYLVSEWLTASHYWGKNFLYSTQSPLRFSNLAGGNRQKITLTIPGPKWVPALRLLFFGGVPFPGPDCFSHPLVLISTQLCNKEGP